MYLILFVFLSTISFVDKIITKYIYNIKITKYYSKYFSIYIIYFNILVNIYYLLYYQNYKLLFFRYIIEHFIINFLFKMLLDRSRPEYSLFLNNKYEGIYNIRFSKNWFKNQSFPSGHVATIYLTYKLYENINYINYLYLIILIITIFSRINLGKHYFSDCIWGIYICKISIIYIFTYQ